MTNDYGERFYSDEALQAEADRATANGDDDLARQNRALLRLPFELRHDVWLSAFRTGLRTGTLPRLAAEGVDTQAGKDIADEIERLAGHHERTGSLPPLETAVAELDAAAGKVRPSPALRAEQAAAAAFTAVHRALGEVPAEFTSAGELATLMAALPPDTPVSIAETVRIDPELDLDATPNRTVAAAGVVSLVDSETVEVVAEDGQVREYGKVIPGIELGAFIVAEDRKVPAQTAAFPPYESAVEAIQDGDLVVALDAECELLNWIAGTLATASFTGGAAVDDDVERESVPAWLDDGDLRRQLHVEGERLRHAAARLRALRERVAVAQADAEGQDPGPRRDT